MEPERSPKLPEQEEIGGDTYILRLYIAGTSPKSQRAILNLKRICEEHLSEKYELEIVDIYQQPTLTQGEKIIATPTLIKTLPPPARRIIGDLSDEKRVLTGLDLEPRS